ncbi:MAG: DUF2142 domain-containing protein [Egibacteraceae bacterium]
MGRRSGSAQRFDLPSFQPLTALRDVPMPVWGLALLFLLVSQVYSVAVPVYQGPDEPQHVDMVLSVGRLEGWAPPRQRLFSLQLRKTQRIMLHYRRARVPRAASEAFPRPRPSFDDFSDEPSTRTVTHVSNHPPLYYIGVATWATLVTGLVPALWDPAFDEVVGVLRLGSGLLLMWLPVATFLTASRLGLARPSAVAAATLPLAIPQLAHLGGVVNNDALLLALAGVLFVMLSFVATSDASRRTALLVGAVGGLALLTKGFALLLPAGVVIAYGATARRGARLRAFGSGLLALSAAFIVGGWWWVRNLLVEGRLQPSGGLANFPHPAGFQPSASIWRQAFYIREIEGFWGRLGNLNVDMPDEAVAAAGSLLLVTIVAAFVMRPDSKGPGRLGLALLLVPVLFLGTLLPVRSWLTYATQSTKIRGMQGRYLFLGLPGLATVAATGMQRLLPRSGRGRRWLPLIVLSGGIALHAVSLHQVLFTYWGTQSDNSAAKAFEALLRWAPWPPALVLTLWSLTGVVLVILLTLLVLLKEPVVKPAPPQEPTIQPHGEQARSHRRRRSGRGLLSRLGAPRGH